MAFDEQFGIRYFENSRRASGSSIVLIHGLGNSLDFWHQVSPKLADIAHVVVLDLPGFGRSRSPAVANFDEYVTTVSEFLRSRSLHQVHLVGHSMGAIVALGVAPRIDQTSGITLIDGTLFTASRILHHPSDALSAPKVGVNLSAQFAGSLIPLNNAVRHAITRNATIRRLLFAPFTFNAAEISPDVLAAALSHNTGRGIKLAYNLATQTDLPTLCRDVAQVEVSLLWGEDDRLLTDEDVQEAKQLLHVTYSESLANCGHWPQLERPDAVVAHIAARIE